MRAEVPFVIAVLTLSTGGDARADFILNFDQADKTHVGGWQSAPPGVEDFPALPGYDEALFEVGNLTNGCGLWPSADPRSGVGTTCTTSQLAGEIRYDTGFDTFFLGRTTEAVLQLFIKVGHPEEADPDSRRLRQNQREELDIYLGNGTMTLELAQLLDDVTELDRDLQNAYYLFTYQPGRIPAGDWFPMFDGEAGSIEFLARLSAASTAEPATLVLLGSGLFAIGLATNRRRSS